MSKSNLHLSIACLLILAISFSVLFASPPEFAMFEMTARFTGMLPYITSFECPLVETDVNSPIPTSERNCFAILFH